MEWDGPILGCCFFPLRKCVFSVAATFWVAKLDFLCCWFFSCLGRFFSRLGRVFSRLGRFFPAASKMHFFLLQRCFCAAARCFFCCFEFFPLRSGIFCWRFFPLRKQLFPAARRFFPAAKRVFFRSDVFFLLRTCVFSCAARRQGARERRVLHWAFATCKLDSAWTNRWQRRPNIETTVRQLKLETCSSGRSDMFQQSGYKRERQKEEE